MLSSMRQQKKNNMLLSFSYFNYLLNVPVEEKRRKRDKKKWDEK